MTADSASKALALEDAQDFRIWLNSTLIPDLKESGHEATAESFEEACRHFDNLEKIIYSQVNRKQKLWPDKPVSRMTREEMRQLVNFAACLADERFRGDAPEEHCELYSLVYRPAEAYRTSGDHPEARMTLADNVIDHIAPWIADYDEVHGLDDGVSDEEIRTPAYAYLQECLDYIFNDRHYDDGGCMYCGRMLSSMCPECKHL